ncbi:hypothetical protein BWP39_01785 [Paraburkholderia acidicola]|uniref:Dual-specificity RNA pseudouridine synthase RluF n=1 Tax=Paraburkholderia acidicola TaxID=1912599 RepID=A0A2A4F8N7_9BURK|nr:pseudouridine synthase [Paraburkholderia acidicola]PCE28954.1 hypothetical protein BWP39_01785 [Paraburkholderia acidicola]
MRLKLTAKHPRPASSERAPVRTGSTSARKPVRGAGAGKSAGGAGSAGSGGAGKPPRAGAAGAEKRPAGKFAAATGERRKPASAAGGVRSDARRAPSERPPRRAEGEPRRFDGERPRGDGPARRADGERPRGDSPARRFDGERPRGDGPARRADGERPRGDSPARRFDGERPRGDGPARRTDGDRPRGVGPARRTDGERPRGDSPARRFDGERPRGDGSARRTDGDRPRGDSPARRFDGERTRGDGPARRADGERPRGDSPARRFDSERPRGDGPARRFDSEPRRTGGVRAPRDGNPDAPRNRDAARPARFTGERGAPRPDRDASDRRVPTERGPRAASSDRSERPVFRSGEKRETGRDSAPERKERRIAQPIKGGYEGRTTRPAEDTRPARPAARRTADEGNSTYPGPKLDDQRSRRAKRADDPKPFRPARERDDQPGTLRLSKLMSELGMCSRREADEWIEKGWVTVDGVVIDTLGTKVRPDQRIDIDPAAQAMQAKQVTILIHKPVGYVSGQAEDGYEPAVALVTPANRWEGDHSGTQFSPSHLRTLAPAGRLDIDSTGLLVLTQDGRVAKQLIGGHSEVDKEYLVRVAYGDIETDVDQHFPAESLALLCHGLSLDDVPLKPAKVTWQNSEQLRFVLNEGKKRQIRHMCEAVGLRVVGLKRVRIGKVMLGALPQGQWRYLSAEELF